MIQATHTPAVLFQSEKAVIPQKSNAVVRFESTVGSIALQPPAKPLWFATALATLLLNLLIPGKSVALADNTQRDPASKENAVSRVEFPGLTVQSATPGLLKSLEIKPPGVWGYASINGQLPAGPTQLTLTLSNTETPLKNSQLNLNSGEDAFELRYDPRGQRGGIHILDLFTVDGDTDVLTLEEGDYLTTISADTADRVILKGSGWKKDDAYSSASLRKISFTNSLGGSLTIEGAPCENIAIVTADDRPGESIDCYDKVY